MQRKPAKSTKGKGSGSTGQARGKAFADGKGQSNEAAVRKAVSAKGAVSLGKQLKVGRLAATFAALLSHWPKTCHASVDCR